MNRRQLVHDLRSLLDALDEQLDRWVAWPGEEYRHAVTLWVAHAHAIEAFDTTPRLALLSVVKGSGKTRVLELLDLVCPNAMFAISTSSSALSRTIDANPCSTVLLDEADTHLGSEARGPAHEDLRAIVNGGYRRNASVWRSAGGDHTPTRFKVFSSVAIAGIGDLPDTVTDRSILVPMRRRGSSDRPIERFRQRNGVAALTPIRERFEEMRPALVDALEGVEPDLPEGIEDRAADCWEPLLAIGDLARGGWAERARHAAIVVNRQRQERAPSLREQLLADCRRVFIEAQADRLTSNDLLSRLTKLDDAEWGELNRGSGLDARGLSKRLRPLGVHPPHTIRVGGQVAKGYVVEDFSDAWDRYCSPIPPQSVTPVTPVIPVTPVTTVTPRAASPGGRRSPNEVGVTDVTDVTDSERMRGAEAPRRSAARGRRVANPDEIETSGAS